jgi:hypothetical protein
MHYGEKAFSRNGNPTIRSKRARVKFGQRRGLSAKDKLQLQRLYCPKTPTVKPSGIPYEIFLSTADEDCTHCEDLRAVLFENNIGLF